jgi:dynein intermediate chain 2
MCVASQGVGSLELFAFYLHAQGRRQTNRTVPSSLNPFLDPSADLSSEPPSAKGLAVFRDPSAVKRTATSVNWHPEGNRIAVAYSILKFQDERLMSGRLPPSSFVWDVTYPNHPVCAHR